MLGVLSLLLAGSMVATGTLRPERFINATASPTVQSNMSMLNLDTGEHIPLGSDPRAVKNFVEKEGQKVFVSTDNETVLSQIRKEEVIDPEVLSSQKTVKMEYDPETGEKVVVPYNYNSEELKQISQNEDVLRAIRERPQVDTSQYSLLNVDTGASVRLDAGEEVITAFQQSAKENDQSLLIARSTDPETLDLISHSYDVRSKVEEMESSELSETIRERGTVFEDSVSGESLFTGPTELLEREDLVSGEALNPGVEDSLQQVESVSEAREQALASSVNRGLNLQSMVEDVLRKLMWAGLIGALIFVLWKFVVPYLVSYVAQRGKSVRHTKEVGRRPGAGAAKAKEEKGARGAPTWESLLVVKPTDTLVEVGKGQTVEVTLSNISDSTLKDIEVTTSVASKYVGELKPGDETEVRIEVSSVSSRDSKKSVEVSFSPIKVGGRVFKKHKFPVPIKVVKLVEEKEAGENCAFHPDKEAVAKCTECGKLLCSDCAQEKDGKILCPDCI